MGSAVAAAAGGSASMRSGAPCSRPSQVHAASLAEAAAAAAALALLELLELLEPSPPPSSSPRS